MTQRGQRLRRGRAARATARSSGHRSNGGTHRYSRWRAVTLLGVYGLMALHVMHWRLGGRTLAPLELNEVMYTLELGIVTAGFIFMAAAVVATAVFGRFFCSWGCHILALEDLCAWLLGRLGIRPKPVRSRVLAWVPLAAMTYMFIWPQAARLALGEPAPILHVRTDAQGWASFLTENFWRNLPGPGIALLTFAVCGFVVVYFLGSRAFCTYACPYGALFGWADRIAPGRIKSTGDCTRCGICTAVCQSRVRVHEEAVRFGRIVDPNCLKDLDCVAACPNGALSYGLARPALLDLGRPPRLPRKPYDFTLGEDLLIAIVFVVALFTYRGLYGQVPFLMTLAIGGIAGYTAVLATRLIRRSHVRINNFQLKIAGGLTRSGRVFAAFAGLFTLFTAHSAVMHYHEYRANQLFARYEHGARSTADAETILRHLAICDRWGLFHPVEYAHRAAALHAAIADENGERGDFVGAIRRLEQACALSPTAAAPRYNLGVLLAQTGRMNEAIAQYRIAESLDPGDADIPNNLGFLLAQRGEYAAAAAQFRRAIELKPDFAHPHFNLGRILRALGQTDDAERCFQAAAKLDPNYAQLLYPRGMGPGITASTH